MNALTCPGSNDGETGDSSGCACTVRNDQQRADAREHQQSESQTSGQDGQALTLSPTPNGLSRDRSARSGRKLGVQQPDRLRSARSIIGDQLGVVLVANVVRGVVDLELLECCER